MLIGANGEIGGKILKNLLSYKNVTVYITERSHRGKYLFPADSKAVLIDFDRRYEYADRCSCIISATSSPHYTITAEKLKNSIAVGKQLTLIDLAVPRDIDSRVEKIEGILSESELEKGRLLSDCREKVRRELPTERQRKAAFEEILRLSENGSQIDIERVIDEVKRR